MPAPAASRPTGKNVQLMATCLCDAVFDDTAIATVEVLEHLGCRVAFPEAQTCCGQPAFNTGDWPAARKVMRHVLRVFGDAGTAAAGTDTDAGGAAACTADAAADTTDAVAAPPVIVPSASCAAMLFHGALLAFENEPELPAVRRLAGRAWELADYIVNALGVTAWPGRFDAKIAFHRSCHARGAATGAAALTLLNSIEGLTVVPFGEPEQCCGFGGTFSVTFPHISKAMGNLKLDHILAAGPDLIVSIDQSCLMSLAGLAAKGGRPVKTMHLAQVLRDALRASEVTSARWQETSN